MARLTERQRAMYATFMLEHQRCFACWHGGGFSREYDGWPRGLDNAHIVGGPGRRHERWAIVRLCKLCHALSHGDRIAAAAWDVGLRYLPRLTQGNLIALKLEMDPSGVDMEALQSVSFKILPTAEPPHAWFAGQRAKNWRVR